MAGIFLSYRREDSAGHAGRLYDRLRERFGAENVFMDVDAIRPGEDFARIIEQRIAQCDVMVALIGKAWLTMEAPLGGRRLDDPDDFVRLEIESALNRGLPVIPVLLAGAAIPTAEQLPSSLERLARLQAFTLSDARFGEEAEALVDAIERYVVSPLSAARVVRPRKRSWGAIAATMLGVGVLAGLIWGNYPGTLQRLSTPSVDLSGRWVAKVPLSEGKTYSLTLDLEVSNGRILGRVQFPAGSGGVTQGTLQRDHITFDTVHQPQFSERQVTTRFEGQVVGEELELIMQYDDVVKRIRARRG